MTISQIERKRMKTGDRENAEAVQLVRCNGPVYFALADQHYHFGHSVVCTIRAQRRCGAGEEANATTGACLACSPDTFRPERAPCVAGSACGPDPCALCPPGMTSPAGAADAAECTACPAGTYRDGTPGSVRVQLLTPSCGQLKDHERSYFQDKGKLARAKIEIGKNTY